MIVTKMFLVFFFVFALELDQCVQIPFQALNPLEMSINLSLFAFKTCNCLTSVGIQNYNVAVTYETFHIVLPPWAHTQGNH